jgi:hypothetical protein
MTCRNYPLFFQEKQSFPQAKTANTQQIPPISLDWKLVSRLIPVFEDKFNQSLTNLVS